MLKTILNWKKYHAYLLFFITTSMSDFKEKTDIFNSFFPNQCTLILNYNILLSQLKLLTEHTLTFCDFSETDILQIINSQDLNKAHGHDMISIRMRGGNLQTPKYDF